MQTPMDTSRTLNVQLLGSFRVTRGNDQVVDLDQPRLQFLLAYLLLHRDTAISRQQLAFAFWPDTSDTQARSNLRTLLHRLLEALPEGKDVLALDRHTVCWRSDARIVLDVAEFEDAAACADRAEKAGDVADARRWLERACAIYTGELLPGCYDDWIPPIRERLSQTATHGLERLMAFLEAAQDFAAAIPHAQRLLRHDPLHEAGYRHLMRLQAATGNRTGVVRAFNACEAVLRKELGVAPDRETQVAYRAALQQAISAAATAPTVPVQRSAGRGNLPVQLDSLIGREREAEQVGRLLTAHRLVTLIGPGGVGKTRLALRVASDLHPTLPEGAWWVDLASLTDDALIMPTIASALEVHAGAGRSTAQALADWLVDRTLLLVLDNCEHLASRVGAQARTLLEAAPRLRILATGQHALGLAGEIAWRVPVLDVPPENLIPPGERTEAVAAALDRYACIRLFVERAQASLPSFALTTANANAVAEICRRLNGVPLAIELAAARIRTLTAEQILARLDDALTLLARQDASPDQPTLPRQQALAATIAWSHELLSQPRRILFRRLAVFAGSFDLDAVEAVCAGHGIPAELILGLLADLEGRSLVEAEPIPGQRRFRMHEVIRQYAAARLAEAGEAERLRTRHLDYYAGLVAAAQAPRAGEGQAAWLDRLAAEHDNLRAALAISLSAATREANEAGLRIVGGLWRFWVTRGFFREGRHWAKTLLAAAPGGASDATPGRLSALRTAAMLARYQTDYADARTLFEQALAVSRRLDDRVAQATITRELGNLAHGAGDYPTALRCYEESLALCRETGDRQGESAVQGNLGLVAWQHGDPVAGRRHLEACLAIRRELGDEVGIAYALHLLADIAWSKGQQAEATSLNAESLSMRRRLGDRWGIAYSLDSLGVIAAQQGDGVGARAHFAEALSLFHELGSQHGLCDVLDHLAGLLADEGSFDSAAQLMAAAAAQRETVGAALPPNVRVEHERQLACLRDGLGAERFRAAWTLGRALTMERAVRRALELTAL